MNIDNDVCSLFEFWSDERRIPILTEKNHIWSQGPFFITKFCCIMVKTPRYILMMVDLYNASNSYTPFSESYLIQILIKSCHSDPEQ